MLLPHKLHIYFPGVIWPLYSKTETVKQGLFSPTLPGLMFILLFRKENVSSFDFCSIVLGVDLLVAMILSQLFKFNLVP